MGSSLKSKSSRARAARSDKSIPQPRRQPVRSKSPTKRARLAEPRETGSAQKVRGLRDGVPETELRGVRQKLELIQSCTQLVGFALNEQNSDLDSDAARVLGFHVTDALQDQIERIDCLLGDTSSNELEEVCQ
jgi:hypothetical protein